MKKIFIPLCLIFASATLWSTEPLLRYDYKGDAPKFTGEYAAPVVTGKPSIGGTDSASAIAFDGKRDFLTVPGSNSLHLTGGGTLAATVKFNDNGTEGGKADAHDMIFFKPDEFLLGRTGDQLYFNMKSGKQWAMTSYAKLPATAAPLKVAATVRRDGDKSEITLYINGKQVFRKRFAGEPDTTDAPVTIGKGWGGPWFLNGELSDLAIYNQPLTESEIATL